MKRDCGRPSVWGAASKGFFCATVFGLSMQIGPVSGTVRSVVAARHGRCTETSSSSSNSTFEEGRAVAKQRAAGRRARRSSRPCNPAFAARPVNGPMARLSAISPAQSVTGTKTDTPILTTPQSISVVTKDQIADQGAQNLVEALRYTPGVTLDTFGATTFFDAFKLRGFDAPRYLDGLRLPFDPGTQFAVPKIEPMVLTD